MRIEFVGNCTLEIMYIGTEGEIFLRRLQCVAEEACGKAIETLGSMAAYVDQAIENMRHDSRWQEIVRSLDESRPMSLSAPLLLQPAASNPPRP